MDHSQSSSNQQTNKSTLSSQFLSENQQQKYAQLTCSSCNQNYNFHQRKPMCICQNRHVCCLKCSQEFIKDEQKECPQCDYLINPSQIKQDEKLIQICFFIDLNMRKVNDLKNNYIKKLNRRIAEQDKRIKEMNDHQERYLEQVRANQELKKDLQLANKDLGYKENQLEQVHKQLEQAKNEIEMAQKQICIIMQDQGQKRAEIQEKMKKMKYQFEQNLQNQRKKNNKLSTKIKKIKDLLTNQQEQIEQFSDQNMKMQVSCSKEVKQYEKGQFGSFQFHFNQKENNKNEVDQGQITNQPAHNFGDNVVQPNREKYEIEDQQQSKSSSSSQRICEDQSIDFEKGEQIGEENPDKGEIKEKNVKIKSENQDFLQIKKIEEGNQQIKEQRKSVNEEIKVNQNKNTGFNKQIDLQAESLYQEEKFCPWQQSGNHHKNQEKQKQPFNVEIPPITNFQLAKQSQKILTEELLADLQQIKPINNQKSSMNHKLVIKPAIQMKKEMKSIRFSDKQLNNGEQDQSEDSQESEKGMDMIEILKFQAQNNFQVGLNEQKSTSRKIQESKLKSEEEEEIKPKILRYCKRHNLNALSSCLNEGQSFDQIKELRMSRNSISSIKFVKNFVNLVYLDLSFNKITKIENLQQNKKITTLFLSSNKILLIENIKHMRGMQTLYLGQNPLDKKSAEYLANAKFQKLERLSISFDQDQKSKYSECIQILIKGYTWPNLKHLHIEEKQRLTVGCNQFLNNYKVKVKNGDFIVY